MLWGISPVLLHFASKSFEKLAKNTEKGDFVDQRLACAAPKCWSKSTTISQTNKPVFGIGPVKLLTPALKGINNIYSIG